MSSNFQTVSNITDSNNQIASGKSSTATPRKLRTWPAIVIVIALWAFFVGIDFVELSMFHRFAFRFGFYGLMLLAFLIWWLGFSRAGWKERGIGVAALVLGTLVAGQLADQKSLGMFGPFGVLLAAFPFVLTLWTLWLVAADRWLLTTSTAVRSLQLSAVIIAPLFFFDLVRWDGLDGGQHSKFSWRWSKTDEEKFLADRGKHVAEQQRTATAAVALRPGDWPEFRGPNRDNQIHDVKLATDWDAHPPKQMWKHRLGPAWSSMIIVDGKLFTQEQRNSAEAVVCYDAATGNEIWAHEDTTRFEEPLAGAGPRGTPTFSAGHIYSLGGTGVLNCLDAATGKPIWTKDITIDGESAANNGSNLRQWGYSNSPLVVGDKVIVFAGGVHEKGLLAYNAATGDLDWKSAAGSDGYSSPQLVNLDGVPALLMDSNEGLFALDPQSGKLLWQHPSNTKMFLPVTQPQPVGKAKFLTQSPEGISLIEVSHKDETWSPAQKWESKQLKPSLNDYVVFDGNVYGFDDGVFCCIDLETGKRRWKAGRYNHGQVLLIADQPLLVVISESGEAVLIAPNPQKLDELARFQMIEGKTWNHPVLAHGKFYVRNGEEIACYDLPLAEKQLAEK